MVGPDAFVCAHCGRIVPFPDLWVVTPAGNRLLSIIIAEVHRAISSPDVSVAMSVSFGDEGSVVPPPAADGYSRFLLHRILTHSGIEYNIAVDLPPGIDVERFEPFSRLDPEVIIAHRLNTAGGGNGHPQK